ncbi:MAG: hypothetical protein ACK5HS_00105 [Mycoplasmatales bacterium]
MNNFRYALMYFIYNFKHNLLMILQIVAITIIIFSMSNTLLEFKKVADQVSNFNIDGQVIASYDYNTDNVKDIEQVKEFIIQNASTSYMDFRPIIDDNDASGYLILNYDKYNHNFINNDTKLSNNMPNIVLGSEYKDKYKPGDVVSIKVQFQLEPLMQIDVKEITLNVNVYGILEPNQNIMSDVNGLETIDESIIVDPISLLDYLNKEDQMSYLSVLLFSSIFDTPKDSNIYDYKKELFNTFTSFGYNVENVRTFKECIESIYFTNINHIQSTLFTFILILIVSIYTIIYYVYGIYNSRKKLYSVFILHGYKISSIKIQLLIEIFFINIISCLICILILKSLSLVILISFIILILTIIPILFIHLLDKKIHYLLKSDY